MQGLKAAAAFNRIGAHATLADDELYAGFFDELFLELFHAHGCGRTDGHDLKAAAGTLIGHHDGAGVKDRFAREINGNLAAVLDKTRVRAVAGCDEVTVEIDNVADADVFEVFTANRRRQNCLAHSVTPLCEIIS